MAIKEVRKTWDSYQLDYVKEFILHDETELKQLPECAVGSKATVASSNKTYVIDRKKNWTERDKAIEEDGDNAGGGVSSWNDLTDKPFGEETGVIFNDTLTFDENGGCGLKNEIPLTVGNTYKVIWNGVEYECVAQLDTDGMGVTVLGDVDYSDAFPFIIMTYPKAMQAEAGIASGVMGDYGETTATLSIEGNVIKTLDPKYLPSGIGGGASNFEELENNLFTKVIEDYLLTETKPTFAPLEEMGGIPAFNPYLKGLPIEGKTYTVNWNGTTYECVARYVENPVYSSVMIGDASLVGGDGNGEPFLMTFALSGGVFNTPVCICLAVAEETADTLSIYGEYERKLYSEHLEKYVYRLDDAVPPLEHMSESQEYRIDYATAFEISTLINNGVTPWLALSFVHPTLDKQSALIRPIISCDSVGGSKVRFYFIYNFVCYEMTVDRVDSLGINNDLIPTYGKVIVKSKEL